MSFTGKRRILNVVAVLIVVTIFAFHKFFIETTSGNTVLAAVLLAFLILNFAWWRCPHCHAYLWKLSPFAKHCPYCGKKLE
ncbi:MAG: hypothetical protein IJF42_06630 [Clostridia bacterium]|nr:hypothetical protein [Clostridia bacterium]